MIRNLSQEYKHISRALFPDGDCVCACRFGHTLLFTAKSTPFRFVLRCDYHNRVCRVVLLSELPEPTRTNLIEVANTELKAGLS